PDAHGGEVRWLQHRDLPLVHRVIRDTVGADLAVAPRLTGRPLDALVEVARLLRRPEVDAARRAAAPARIHADAGIAIGHPLLGIDDLPVLILVGRSGDDVRVLLGHAAPLIGIEILEVEPLAVRTVRDDDGIFPGADRAEDVGPEHEAVRERNRDVP